MKLDVLIHIGMVVITTLILVFNFNNVFGNLEASLVATTWVVVTSHRLTHKKIDRLHETLKNQNKEN